MLRNDTVMHAFLEEVQHGSHAEDVAGPLQRRAITQLGRPEPHPVGVPGVHTEEFKVKRFTDSGGEAEVNYANDRVLERTGNCDVFSLRTTLYTKQPHCP